MRYFTILLLASIGILSCTNQDSKPQETTDEHDHGSVPILIFNENMELFAEAGQLVVGDTVNIRAHLTFLNDYSPAQKGELYYRMIMNPSYPDWQGLELLQPGIFTASMIPEKAGPCSIEFRYIEDTLELVFVSDAMEVYAHDEDVPAEEHVEGSSFTKEQAWKTKFGLMRVEPQEFIQALHCSGEVSLSPNSKIDIIAPSNGRIAFSGAQLMEGSIVKEGAILFTLLGTGVGNDNILVELNTAKAEYEKDLANLDRKEKLLKLEAVSQKEFEEARATFEISQKRFQILNNQVNENGLVIKSPASGYVTDFRIVSNSYANKGTVLVSIIRSSGATIIAQVPSTQADKISRITSANIKLPSDSQIHPLSEWGGRLISVGRAIDPRSGMIPVYFSMNNFELTTGLFVEVWLLINPIPNQIVVPESSLLEEYGQYYVYVQVNGETYEKRLIEVSDNNGEQYLVAGGLNPGEVIVSQGALAVKVANAMGAAPVHSH